MSHFWWIVAGLFLLSRGSGQTSSAPGGAKPVEAISDAQGTALDANTGMPVVVAHPLPVTIQGGISDATSFGVDAGDESFLKMPAIDSSLTKIVPTQPVFSSPTPAQGGMVRPLSPSGIYWIDTPPTAAPPPQSFSPANGPFGSDPDLLPALKPGDPRDSYVTAAPLPATVPTIAQLLSTVTIWNPDGTQSVVAKYSDGQTITVPYGSVIPENAPPQQVATTPLIEMQNASNFINPITGRIALDNV